MFAGSFNDPKNDPILISDVQADAFKALLEYIYTDKININNVDKAFDLCYAAKKYMLPFVVDQCTQYLWSDLSAKNACRAYEFARLFEEPSLQEKCLQIICTKTLDVIQDSSFEEVELSTIITILDQDDLNVDSELSLFFALNRYAEKHGLRSDNPNETSSPSPDVEGPQEELPEDNIIEEVAGPSNRPDPQPQQPPPAAQRAQELAVRDAVKKIRFLTLTPQQFAEGPARTNLLSQSEAFAILMNISTPNSVYPMPEGFSLNKNSRVPFDSRSPSPPSRTDAPLSSRQAIAVSVPQHAPVPSQNQNNRPQTPNQPISLNSPDIQYHQPESPNFNYFQVLRDQRMAEERRIYSCIRTIQHIREVQNRSVLDCSFTFSVDRNVSILGLQMYTQIKPSSIADRYSEIIYAHLLDSHGSRLTYTHSNQRVPYDSVNDILFDRPMFIQSNKVYKIGVVFNKIGFYQEHEVQGLVRSSNITFTFSTGNPNDTCREGLIRGIIYSL